MVGMDGPGSTGDSGIGAASGQSSSAFTNASGQQASIYDD